FGTAAATTTVNVSGSAALTLAALQGANNTSAVSVYNQSGGSVTVGVPRSTAESAYAANSGYGYFNLSGGSVLVNSRFTAASNGGGGGKGVARIGGGAGSASLTAGDLLAVSRGAGSIGELTVLPNGAVTFTGTGTVNMLIHGNNTLGTGFLNIAGGTFSSLLKPVSFGNGTDTNTSLGMLNVGAGTLELSSNLLLNTIASGTNRGYVNFTGGTVKLLATTSGNLLLPASNGGFTGLANTIFGKLTNSTANLDGTGAASAVSSTVGTTQDFVGGVTIDTNGFSSAISGPLVAPTGGGVAQGNISITDAGAGYAAPPTVVFSNPTAPNATPAAGYALVSGGQLTGIVITSPGCYDSADTVTVTLTGGGASTPATVAGIAGSSLTANTSGGLTKTGAGPLTLSGANTYTGMTTVNAGTLTVSGAGTLSASSGLTVGNGAAFNYLPTTVGTSLVLSTLSLNDGSSIGLAWDATTSNSLAASGAATVGTGAGVGINLAGIPTLGSPYTILTAASGLDTGSYVLLNPTDFYATISKSPTAVTVTATTSATPLTAAYWKGGYTGFSGVWAVSNGLSGGSGLSNWTTNAAGTVNTALVPGAGTDVFLSASGAAAGDQNAMTLGANMVVNSLLVNDPSSPNANPVTLLGTDGATLTLAAASGTGITVNVGAGAVTLAANVALGASQTWSNHSANPLTVSGTVSGASDLTKAGTGLVNITGAAAVGSVTVDTGTLYMGAQTGASTITTLGASTPVTLNGTSNLTIRRTNTGAVDLIGAIGGTGSLTLLGDNAVSVVSGDFTLNNASTYSGGTTIIGARAAPTTGAAFGTGPVTVGASAGIFVNAATQTFTNDFIIGGPGWNEPSGYLGALRLNGTTLQGNITLTADTRITGINSSTLSG
ncbi:MAG: autotransporter-associated beta strand repeat-containing protein, partial [Akkermansiaceae bacterium]|nr:autotransporter-associated beta strand repeat-containing protein [Akkermansiaceae bacterium]